MLIYLFKEYFHSLSCDSTVVLFSFTNNLMKKLPIIKIFLTLLFSFIIIIVFVEIVLRFLPVASGFKGKFVTTQDPLLCFEPNSEFTYSVGPLMLGSNVGKINNYGFVNDNDYENNVSSPLLAVIGDSYIEAFLVPFSETIHGRISRLTTNRVYSFGVSGSPLSQYLGYCRYIRDHFKPNGLIINVVGNDFDESLFEFKKAPGYHYFYSDLNGTLTNRLLPNQLQTHLLGIIPIDSFIASLMRQSRLLQYFYKNVKILSLKRRIQEHLFEGDTKIRYVGNTEINYSQSRLKKSKLAVDAFFRDLPLNSNLSPKDILFTVDGLRQSIYDDSLRKASLESYFGVMRKYFIEQAQSLGYEVADLDNAFMIDYKISKKRFEPDYDGHWNSYAHGIVAEQVLKTTLWSRFSEKSFNGITP